MNMNFGNIFGNYKFDFIRKVWMLFSLLFYCNGIFNSIELAKLSYKLNNLICGQVYGVIQYVLNSYDLIKVIITTGGVLGTSKYSVYVKDDDKLKNNLVVENEVINGDYQQLAGGLQIRFAGANDSSVAVQNNEWEIEVFGAYEETDSSTGRTVKMTRYKKYGTIY